MKKINIILVAAFLLTSGMLIGQLLPARAEAQQPAGKFTECAAVTMYVNAGKSINAGQQPTRTIKVPNGWTPVGGSSRGGEPTVLYCR